MGGVWEWTSSLLVKHEGFEPMSLYPNYTGKLIPLLPAPVQDKLTVGSRFL
jgi:formylglycine-generating enzyme required for sulfatase activity